MAGKTLYDKVWDAHVVGTRDDGQTMLYIDQQLLHEVTSPQAFEGLALAGRNPWRIDANLATPDHNVPTENRAAGIDGIGPAKAAAIVAYRAEHGPFKTVDDLLLVRGIGQATLDRNRDRLTAATP